MELILSRPDRTTWQVDVACDGQHSHTFDVSTLLPGEAKGLPHPLVDPVTYGKALYGALFPPDSSARQALGTRPARLLLVALDEELDALPWEYACGPDGALASTCAFVRALPEDQRAQLPTMLGDLHLVAVASSPLSHTLAPLNIEGEWTRLSELIRLLLRLLPLLQGGRVNVICCERQ